MDWKHVADAVRQRRHELGLTQEEAATRSGGAISSANWRVLEAAKRESYRAPTLLGVARALNWRADAIQRLLAGEEPVAIEQLDSTEQMAEMLTRVDAALAELNRRIDDLEARQSGSESPPPRVR